MNINKEEAFMIPSSIYVSLIISERAFGVQKKKKRNTGTQPNNSMSNTEQTTGAISSGDPKKQGGYWSTLWTLTYSIINGGDQMAANTYQQLQCQKIDCICHYIWTFVPSGIVQLQVCRITQNGRIFSPFRVGRQWMKLLIGNCILILKLSLYFKGVQCLPFKASAGVPRPQRFPSFPLVCEWLAFSLPACDLSLVVRPSAQGPEAVLLPGAPPPSAFDLLITWLSISLSKESKRLQGREWGDNNNLSSKLFSQPDVCGSFEVLVWNEK